MTYEVIFLMVLRLKYLKCGKKINKCTETRNIAINGIDNVLPQKSKNKYKFVLKVYQSGL